MPYEASTEKTLGCVSVSLPASPGMLWVNTSQLVHFYNSIENLEAFLCCQVTYSHKVWALPGKNVNTVLLTGTALLI